VGKSFIGLHVVVYWEDALLDSETGEDLGPFIQESSGWIHKITPKRLILAHSRNPLGRDDFLKIPKGMVRKVRRLKDGTRVKIW